jgi:glycosyltransferase involved in cell wall biosynthesis
MSGRIAVVFPFPLEPVHRGKDVLLIPEGLQSLGFAVELHCPEARGGDWPLPVVEAGAEGLSNPRHWEGRSLTGAIVFSFLRHARLLAAVAACGARVLAKADTTGQVIARVHPRATLEYALFDPPSFRRSLLGAGYWLARVGPLYRREASELVRAVDGAAATVVETHSARTAAELVLRRRGAGALAHRLVVIPNPVEGAFVREPVTADRERQLVAVGRWDLRVKDAPLLAAALDVFLRERPDHRAVVVGPGWEHHSSAGASGRIEYRGQLAQRELVPLLGQSRTVVTSSRWESFSLSSHEGLAMGCTVVGPDLAPLREAVARGPYGTLAERRDARSLADALSAEADAWERGERDPLAGARFWRGDLAPEIVANRLAGLLQSRAGRESTLP